MSFLGIWGDLNSLSRRRQNSDQPETIVQDNSSREYELYMTNFLERILSCSVPSDYTRKKISFSEKLKGPRVENLPNDKNGTRKFFSLSLSNSCISLRHEETVFKRAAPYELLFTLLWIKNSKIPLQSAHVIVERVLEATRRAFF